MHMVSSLQLPYQQWSREEPSGSFAYAKQHGQQEHHHAVQQPGQELSLDRAANLGGHEQWEQQDKKQDKRKGQQKGEQGLADRKKSGKSKKSGNRNNRGGRNRNRQGDGSSGGGNGSRSRGRGKKKNARKKKTAAQES